MARRAAGQPIRVLIVESSRIQCALLSDIFKNNGMDVIGVAFNGPDAVAAARQQRPDVIVMEIALPKLDGYQAARQIMESVPTPIVLISSTATQKQMELALDAGALTVVVKPTVSH